MARSWKEREGGREGDERFEPNSPPFDFAFDHPPFPASSCSNLRLTSAQLLIRKHRDYRYSARLRTDQTRNVPSITRASIAPRGKRRRRGGEVSKLGEDAKKRFWIREIRRLNRILWFCVQ